MISTKFKPGDRVYYTRNDEKVYGVVCDESAKAFNGNSIKTIDSFVGDSGIRVWAYWSKKKYATHTSEDKVVLDNSNEIDFDLPEVDNRIF